MNKNTDQIKALLDEIVTNNEDDKATLAGLNLTIKLLSNIVSNPTEEKYRTVNASNKTIATKVFSLGAEVGLLFEIMDFIPNSEENTYIYVSENVRTLAHAVRLIEDAVEPVKCKFMTPEELEKHELIKANNKAFAEKQAADKARIEEAKKSAY